MNALLSPKENFAEARKYWDMPVTFKIQRQAQTAARRQLLADRAAAAEVSGYDYADYLLDNRTRAAGADAIKATLDERDKARCSAFQRDPLDPCAAAYQSLLDRVDAQIQELHTEFPQMTLPTRNCQRSGCGAIDRAMWVAAAAGLEHVDILLYRIDEAANNTFPHASESESCV